MLIRSIQGVVLALGLLISGVASAQSGLLNHAFGTHGKTSFVVNNNGNDAVAAEAIYPSSSPHAGKIILAGDGYESGKTQFVTTILRLNADGQSLDTSFSGGGKVTVDFGAPGPNTCKSVLIQPDDKILVLADHLTGTTPSRALCLARFNADGSPDTTFGSGGTYIAFPDGQYFFPYVGGMVLQKDGQIVVAGQTDSPYRSCIARVKADGSESHLFAVNMRASLGITGSYEWFTGVTLDDATTGSQSIYAVGTLHSSSASAYTATIARFDKDGVLQSNASFEFGGVAGGSVARDVVFHDFGGAIGKKLVVGGAQGGSAYVGLANFGLARFTTDTLTLDTSFSTDGKLTWDTNSSLSETVGAERLAIQSDQKILIGGKVESSFKCIRYNPDGSLDASLASQGYLDYYDMYATPMDFRLDNRGDIVTARSVYDSDWTVRSYGAVGLHTSDVAMTWQRLDNQGFTQEISRLQGGRILRLDICADGSLSPLDATGFTFNTNGTTNPTGDIVSARLYYTGPYASFSYMNQVGSAISSPNGTFTFTGSQTLAHGENYFWLVYETPASPTLGNLLDAECTAVTVGGVVRTPSPTAPAGARTIQAPAYPTVYSTYEYGDYITSVTFAGINNNTGSPGATTAGYSDYTSTVPAGSVTGGQSYLFSGGAYSEYSWPGYPASLAVWCDWNQNYDFGDPGEFYLISDNVIDNTPQTLSIHVPANALAGTTRMRVVMFFNGDFPYYFPDAGDLLYAEAEDYVLNVTAAPVTTINSLVRQNPVSSLTNAVSVTCRATFGTGVTGVTASNFDLSPKVTGASISSVAVVAGSSNTQWDITVNTGTGEGTLTLRLENVIEGMDHNISTTLPYSDQSYTLDRTAPTVAIGSPSVVSTVSGPVSYTVTYADANFNAATLSESDVTVNATGTALSTGVLVTGSGLIRTVTLTGISGNGTLGISLPVATATDAAGNTAPSVGPSATVQVLQRPTTQAHSLVFSGVTDTRMKLDWTCGDGARRAVFLLQGNSGTPAPVDDTTYTAHTVFQSGSQIGSSGWYCVYDGTGTSVTVTGLTIGTTYRAMVCEYNGFDGIQKYLATPSTNNPRNGATLSGYAVQVSASHGSVTKSPNQAVYLEGTTVTLTATPDAHYHFTGWTDAVTTSTNPLVLTIDTTKTLTANFALDEYALAVNASNGSATRSPDQATYPHGTTVTLTATPDAHHHFTGWTGSTTSTLNPLSVAMTSTMTLTANFALDEYPLTLYPDLHGSASKSPDQTTYPYGTTVTLTATPNTGYHFLYWLDGATTVTANPYQVTMDSTRTLAALFEINDYALTVNADANGSVLKSPDQTTYTYGLKATLTAVPNAGYHFIGWTGDVTTSTNPLVLVMDSTKTLTAHFEIDVYELTVQAGANGSVLKSPDQTTCTYGTTITLTATPDLGYHFTGWTGDVTTSTNPLVLTMDSTKTLTANFAINEYALTVNATHGSVAKSPDLAVYNHGTTVTLTATPDSGYHFIGWFDGVTTRTANPLDVGMNSTKTLTANFAINEYGLTLNAAANGSASKSPDQMSYTYGTTVTLTATPDAHYHFTGWTGSTTSTLNPLDVAVTSTLTLTAHFAINEYPLTVSSDPNGSASKSPDQTSYTYGTTVTLTATPNTGYHFLYWIDGATTVTANPYQVTMDSTRTLTARFEANMYALTVNTDANGSVLKSPDQTTYPYGLKATLTAVPDAGYHFMGWTGDVTTSTNPLALVMDSTKTLVAHFEIDVYELTVQAGANGSVSKSPDQTTCTYGTTVTLTATPDSGYYFFGWTGDVTTATNPLVLTMDSTKTLTANFSVLEYALEVVAEHGTVSQSPDQPVYADGTTVTLTATPAVGYHFVGWFDGVTTRTANPLDLGMDSTKTLTANFAINEYALTVNASNGSVAKSPDHATYSHGTTVTLTATPEVGYHFTGWTGATTSTLNPLDIGMDSTKTLTAHFAINEYALTVDASNGSVVTSPDQPIYIHGTTVTLTATPAVGYHFTGWTGATTSTLNPLAIGMDSTKTLTAHFAINEYALTVNASNGSVVKSPDQPIYIHGTTVTLTATPEVGYHFTGWTGATTSTLNPLDIGMDSTKTLTAHFAINTYGLTATSAGHGSVSKSPDQAAYTHGSVVRLTATPEAGYHFSGWTGDVTGASNPLDVTMDSTKTLTATFAINTYALSISAENGTVTKSPDLAVYNHGTTVTLTATPATGYRFSGWTGAVTSTQNPLVVTVDAAKSLTANFILQGYELNVGAVNGSVAKSPDQAVYAHGTVVTLTATPDPSYHFIGWTGDVTSTVNPLAVTMDSTKTLTAHFAINTYVVNVQASANGAAVKSPDLAVYPYGSTVTLTATPAVGYHFTGWSGTTSSTRNPLVLTVDSTQTLTAGFAINSYPLSVIAENGTVSKSPDQAVYEHGSAVILTATPDAFYQFVGWSGSATGTTNPLTLTMDSTKTLTARFEAIEYDLVVQAVDGRVAVSPFGARQTRGTTVTLLALPNPGYSFLGWVGDVPFGQEADNPLKFSILADTSVTAVFEPVSGPVLAWGSNSLGQRDVPQPNSGYAAIASGYYHSLAVKADGSVAAWGQNESGQCDLPTTNTGFVAVAAGFRHSLGLKADGSVVGWGENYSGECTAPEPNTSFTAVSAGFRYSMGLKRDGSVVVWGSDNNAALKTVPEPNSGFVAISAGYMHGLALKADGTIVAWGNNELKQTQVPAPNADFVAVAAGMWFSLGLKADGSIVAWGQNDQGQCRVPTPNAGFVGLAAGSKHGLGLRSDGSLVAWGDNRLGQCVISEPNIGCVAISAGAEHSLAIKTGGLLKVVLTPAEAVEAGAQWRLTDEKADVWHNSGASVSLLAGTFTLEFKDVVGWDTPTTRSVTIRPNEFTEASATYGRHVWTLTTSSTLHGSIQVSSEGTTFTHGTSLTLTARPDEGYLFAGWEGDVPAGLEKTNPLPLVMDSDKTLKAVFELYIIRYPLTVSVAGTGSGSVQKTPDQILYDAGAMVTLTAAPGAGSSFSGWLGDVPAGSEMVNPLVLVMDSTRTLTATFSLGGGGNQYPLQIATAGTGSGTVQRVPEQVVYAEGTTVTLTPLPALDSAFTGWTGDVPAGQENANPLVVTMDATRTLTAVFTRDAVAPSVAVSSPVDDPTSATVFPMTVTFSEPVTGFTAEDLVTSNAVVSNFVAAQGASVYTFDLMVTVTRFCQVTVDVPAGVAFDVANNPNTAAAQFVRSYEVAGAVAPTVQLTSNAVSPTRSRAIPVTIAFDQDVTGFVAGDLALGNATAQNFLALDAKTYTVELVPVADGEVTVTVPADVALSPVGMGNWASTTPLTFLYDGTAPTVTLSAPVDDPTSVSRTLVKVTFSEPVTTLTQAGIEITGGTVRNLVQLDTVVYGFVVDTQVDGDVSVRIKPGVVLDGVGNANTASAPLTWTFDTLAPQVTLSAVEKTSETRIPVTVTFSEPVKGFEVSDLVTSGGVAQNLAETGGTGLSYTFDFVVTTTRTATLLAVLSGGSCADRAGNANTASLPLAIFYEPKPPVLLPLDAPTSVTASDGEFNYKIAVAWSVVPEATHYQIYRSTSLDGTRIIIGAWQTATAFNDTSVEPETEYYYWVRAAADVTGSRASDLSEPDFGWMSSSEVVPSADYKIVYHRCTFEENTLTTGSLVFKTSSPASWVKIIRLPRKPSRAVDRPGRIAYRTLPALPILRIEGDMRSLYSMVEIERLETSGTLKTVTTKGANIALVSAGSLGAVRIAAYRNSSPASSGTAAEFASTSIYSAQSGSSASVLLAGSILADLKSAQSFRFVKSSTKLYQVKMATGRERRISLGGIGSVARVVEDAYGVVSSEPIVSNSALEAPEIGLVQVTGGPVVCDRIAADVQQVRALSAQYRIPASKSQPVAVQGNVRVSEIVSGTAIRKIEARATRADGTWMGGAIGHLDDFNLLRVVAPDLGTIWGDQGVSGRFVAGTDDAGQPNCQGKIGKFGTKRGVGAFRGQAYCVKMPLFSPEKGLDFEVFLTPPVQ